MSNRGIRRKEMLAFGVFFLCGGGLAWIAKGCAVQAGDWKEYLDIERYSYRRLNFHIREPGAVALWGILAQISHVADQRLHPKTKLTDEDLQSEVFYLGKATTVGQLPENVRLKSFLAEKYTWLGFRELGAISGGCWSGLMGLIALQAGACGWKRRIAASVPMSASAIMLTFVNHAEFYAPLNAALLFYYWRALRWFDDPTRRNFGFLAFAAFLAVNIHRVAIFHVAALLIFVLGARRQTRNCPPSRLEAGVLVGFTVIGLLVHIIPVLLASFDLSPILVYETYNPLWQLLTPWTESWREYVVSHSRLGAVPLYTLGSMAHWRYFGFFLLMGSPVGLPVCIGLARRVVRPDELFVAASAVCAWLWAFFWHPYVGYGDWDLFTNPAVATNLLAAILILRSA